MEASMESRFDVEIDYYTCFELVILAFFKVENRAFSQKEKLL